MSDFNDWYQCQLGKELGSAEKTVLSTELQNIFGYNLLLLGASDSGLIDASRIMHRVSVVSEVPQEQPGAINLTIVRGSDTQLPIRTDSIDALIFYHSMDFSQDPHQALREAERVLVAEGHIFIVGFNPGSLWGLYRLIKFRRKSAPWNGSFRRTTQVKDWLRLLGFELINTRYMFHRPPVQRESLLNKFGFMEKIMPKLLPFSGASYLIVARKKVSTMTPIKPRWRRNRKMVGGVVDTASQKNANQS